MTHRHLICLTIISGSCVLQAADGQPYICSQGCFQHSTPHLLRRQPALQQQQLESTGSMAGTAASVAQHGDHTVQTLKLQLVFFRNSHRERGAVADILLYMAMLQAYNDTLHESCIKHDILQLQYV
jgi:hypothetical protein